MPARDEIHTQMFLEEDTPEEIAPPAQLAGIDALLHAGQKRVQWVPQDDDDDDDPGDEEGPSQAEARGFHQATWSEHLRLSPSGRAPLAVSSCCLIVLTLAALRHAVGSSGASFLHNSKASQLFDETLIIKGACLQGRAQYKPLNMPGEGKTTAKTPADCQARCRSVPGCAHMSWWLDESCHLQDASAVRTAADEGALSGLPSCDKGTFCFANAAKWMPLDMDRKERSQESSASRCQARCKRTAGCRHFSWFPNGGCHLQDSSAQQVVSSSFGTTSGPPDCDREPAARQLVVSSATSAPTAAPEMFRQACLKPNARFEPLDMKGEDRTDASTPAECQARCQSTPGCAHISWWFDGGCHLQDADAKQVEGYQQALSGPGSCDEDLYCYRNGKKWMPLLMDSQERTLTKSPEECQVRCKQTSRCEHWTWLPDGGCHVQDEKAHEEPAKANVISGPLVCVQAVIQVMGKRGPAIDEQPARDGGESGGASAKLGGPGVAPGRNAAATGSLGGSVVSADAAGSGGKHIGCDSLGGVGGGGPGAVWVPGCDIGSRSSGSTGASSAAAAVGQDTSSSPPIPSSTAAPMHTSTRSNKSSVTTAAPSRSSSTPGQSSSNSSSSSSSSSRSSSSSSSTTTATTTTTSISTGRSRIGGNSSSHDSRGGGAAGILTDSKHVEVDSCSNFGCGGEYVKEKVCQCNSLCQTYNNCCEDYKQKCVQSTTTTTAWPATLRVSNNSCFYNMVRYEPSDMDGAERTTATSPEDCQARCGRTPGCVTFGFWGQGECHLQDAWAKPTRANLKFTVSGPAHCSKDSGCFERMVRYQYTGGKGGVLGDKRYGHKTHSPVECQALCKRTEGCASFGWWADGICTFQDSTAERMKTELEGTISGRWSCSAETEGCGSVRLSAECLSVPNCYWENVACHQATTTTSTTATTTSTPPLGDAWQCHTYPEGSGQDDAWCGENNHQIIDGIEYFYDGPPGNTCQGCWCCKRKAHVAYDGLVPAFNQNSDGFKFLCFSVTRGQGVELDLMRQQLAKDAGIFGCNKWMVLSDTIFELAQLPQRFLTTLILTQLVGQHGGEYSNLQVFLDVWETIRQDGHYKDADWVVKTDPDTVFFPDRLRDHLRWAKLPNRPTFFANCEANQDIQAKEHKHFMYGPMEVFSTSALESFFMNGQPCISPDFLQQFKWEERFMTHCLLKLKVHLHDDLGMSLLGDPHCNAGKVPSCGEQKVAFHNFSTPESWMRCWAIAVGQDPNLVVWRLK